MHHMTGIKARMDSFHACFFMHADAERKYAGKAARVRRDEQER